MFKVPSQTVTNKTQYSNSLSSNGMSTRHLLRHLSIEMRVCVCSDTWIRNTVCLVCHRSTDVQWLHHTNHTLISITILIPLTLPQKKKHRNYTITILHMFLLCRKWVVKGVSIVFPLKYYFMIHISSHFIVSFFGLNTIWSII